MSNIIYEFYKKLNVDENLIKFKMSKFKNHLDVAKEFEYWIQNREYWKENPISIEGYTAKKISEISKYMIGEGAFLMLIELRENRENALKMINGGFKLK